MESICSGEEPSFVQVDRARFVLDRYARAFEAKAMVIATALLADLGVFLL